MERESARMHCNPCWPVDTTHQLFKGERKGMGTGVIIPLLCTLSKHFIFPFFRTSYLCCPFPGGILIESSNGQLFKGERK